MKSLILDLEEDLTNEQIDAIITKLQARKKSVKKNKPIQLAKKEKELLVKLGKMLDYDYIKEMKTYYSNEEYPFETTLCNIEDNINGKIECAEGEIEDCKYSISDCKDEIKELENRIWSDEKDIERHKKQIKHYEEVKKLFKKLEKLFKNKKL